ncbi:MAG: DUF819 family protein [Bacteroidota bacterium]
MHTYIYVPIQIALLLGIPWLSQYAQSQKRIGGWLNPVIICYGTGILFSIIPPPHWGYEIAHWFRDLTLLLGIPLLLYATNLSQWWKSSKEPLFSFVLCIISGWILAVSSGFFWSSSWPEAKSMSGMMVGLYTGGTPNMNAVGRALRVDDSLLLMANTTDILLGGLLLVFLTSVAKPIYRRFLPAYSAPSNTELSETTDTTSVRPPIWQPLLLTVGVVGASVGITFLTMGGLGESSITVLLLALTSFSLIVAQWPRVRSWGGTFALGEYFLLVFCVALGMLVDFSAIFSTGTQVIIFMTSVLAGTVILHLLLARWWKIDADTVLISSTAALYGPVFVAQVASAIGNKSLVFSGIALGLLGYALGNFLGIGTFYFLQWILG